MPTANREWVVGFTAETGDTGNRGIRSNEKPVNRALTSGKTDSDGR